MGIEDFERFEKALRLVERYETYLFRRAMGIALIDCGIVIPFSAFLVLKAQSIAEILDMSSEAFIAFVPPILLLIGIVIIIYFFTSAHVVTSRMRKYSFWKDFPHIVVMFILWFLSFFLTRYVPETYAGVSWLWAGGFASIASYLVLRKEPANWNYPELLIVGLMCLVASLPLMAIKDSQLVVTVTFAVFSVSFIVGGVYSLINASMVLSERDK